MFFRAPPSGRAVRHSASLRPCGQPSVGRLGSHPWCIPPTLPLPGATPPCAPARLTPLPAPTLRYARSFAPYLRSITPCACYGSGRFVRPACATATPPHPPGSSPRRRLRSAAATALRSPGSPSRPDTAATGHRRPPPTTPPPNPAHRAAAALLQPKPSPYASPPHPARRTPQRAAGLRSVPLLAGHPPLRSPGLTRPRLLVAAVVAGRSTAEPPLPLVALARPSATAAAGRRAKTLRPGCFIVSPFHASGRAAPVGRAQPCAHRHPRNRCPSRHPRSPYATPDTAHTPAHRTAGHGAGSPLLPAHQPPRRRGPRRAVPPAPPDTAAAPLTPARRTAAAQPGRPSHHRSTPGSASAPLPSVQAAGQKSPPPAKSFCVPATQAEARPASRRVLLGEPPNPRHHALADARSSASGSAAGKWLLHPHKARFAEVCWGPRGRPPNPLAEAFKVFVWAAPPRWPRPGS